MQKYRHTQFAEELEQAIVRMEVVSLGQKTPR